MLVGPFFCNGDEEKLTYGERDPGKNDDCGGVGESTLRGILQRSDRRREREEFILCFSLLFPCLC